MLKNSKVGQAGNFWTLLRMFTQSDSYSRTQHILPCLVWDAHTSFEVRRRFGRYAVATAKNLPTFRAV